MQITQKRRRASIVAVCAASAVVLAYGVQSAVAGPRAHTSATTTINFVTTNTNTPGFAPVVAAFEAANPNITVNASYLNSNQYNSLIPTELAAGNAPDVFTAFPGTGALPSLKVIAGAGDLEALPMSNGKLTGDFKAIPANALPGVTVKGKIYGYPLGQSAYFMLYNETAFKSLGLTVPKTFAQLNALCTRVLGDGKIPIEQAGSVQPNNGVMATQLASGPVYLADPNWNNQKAAGKTSFVKSAGWNAALTEMQYLAQHNCFEPGVAGQTVPGASAQFASGQALIWIANSQNIGLTFAIDPNFPLGIAAQPAPTVNEQDVMVAYPQNLVVNAHSANLAAAEQFQAFFAEATEDNLWAKGEGYSSDAQVDNAQLSPFLAPLGSFYKDGKTRVNPFFGWPNPVVFADESTYVQGLLTGQTTPQTTLAQMDSDW